MPTTIDQLLNQAVEKIYPSKAALSKLLKSGRRLTVYQGFDPTSPDLHLGHTIGLRKLRQFQDLGHKVIFLFGDFTATIGDPTGKSQTRNRLSPEQVKANSKKYLRQAEKIINFSGANPASVKYNSTWLAKLNFTQLINLATHFTLQQLIERDMFQERVKHNQPIYLHEFFYPLMQGYDSVAMDVDVEIGGNDQTFNMLTGRTLKKALGKKEKIVMALKLLTDNRGVKIGKTEGNAISLDLPPAELYGRVMALSDDSIIPIFNLATDVPKKEIAKIRHALQSGQNPITAKKLLAHTIVTMYHSKNLADLAQTRFEQIFQKHLPPSANQSFSLTQLQVKPNLPSIMLATQLASSKSHAKQLIKAGSVWVNNHKVLDPSFPVRTFPATIQSGKKKTTIKITE